MHEHGGVFTRSRRPLTAGILLSVTAIACEGMAVATVLPSIAVDLGGLGDYGWAFSAFMLASLIGAIAGGQSADRGDVVTPARLGFAAFGLGLLVAGFAPIWPVFLMGRAVQGFGAGSLIAVAYVAVARGFPEALRPRLMALLSSAWVLPSLVGPAVAGQVAEHASWRWVFVGILPPVLLGAGMLLPSLRRLATAEGSPAVTVRGDHQLLAAEGARPPGAPAGGRLLPALGLAVGVSLLLLAASLSLLPAALALAAVGLAIALPTLQRLLPRGTFSATSGLPAAVAMRALLAGGFFGAEALIPLGLATDRSVPPSLVGLSLTAGALSWVAGSWVQDRAEAAARGAPAQRALRAAGGLLFVLVGIGAAAAVMILPTIPLETVVAAWAAAGLGMGLAYPAATLTALGAAASGEEGSAAASLQVAETIGTAVGTGAAGALYGLSTQLDRAASDGLTWGFALACIAIVSALLPALRLAPALRGSGRYAEARTS